MGMFDSFYFKEGILPDNKEHEDEEFQTKCLDRNLDNYKVDVNGIVDHYPFESKTKSETSITNEVIVYSSRWYPDVNDDNAKNYEQEYKIMIVNNKIVYAEKISENGYDIKD